MKRRRKEQAEGERRSAFEALITEASKAVWEGGEEGAGGEERNSSLKPKKMKKV